jgi:nucleotide-binding universal stress UspA family protein
VSVVEPVSVPASASLLPASARGHIRREVKDLNQERSREGQAALNKAVSRLNRCGWSAKGDLRIGAPLERLLSAVDAHRADVLVLGARAVSGLERALLGSVANGAVNRSRVPVLLVR